MKYQERQTKIRNLNNKILPQGAQRKQRTQREQRKLYNPLERDGKSELMF